MNLANPDVRSCLRRLCGPCVALAVLACAGDPALAAAARASSPPEPGSVQLGPTVTAKACANRFPARSSRVRPADVAFCLAAPLLYDGRGAVAASPPPPGARHDDAAYRNGLLLAGRTSRTSALVRLLSSIPPRPTLEFERGVLLTAERCDRGLGAVLGVHYTF